MGVNGMKTNREREMNPCQQYRF